MRAWAATSSPAARTGRATARAAAGGGQEHGALGIEVRVADVDLEEEAVELGFRERVGALLLDGVLGGEHVEGARQGVVGAADGDPAFLHGLQQGGLGAWAGAVDLVGHQQLAEDRAGDEAEGAAAVSSSSSTSLPVMSAGIRSGVNWTRLGARPRTVPRVSTRRVLPRPGTPTRRAWPPAGG